MKTRQMGAIPPSAILSQKGIARYGGVSRIGPLRDSGLPEFYLGPKHSLFEFFCMFLADKNMDQPSSQHQHGESILQKKPSFPGFFWDLKAASELRQ